MCHWNYAGAMFSSSKSPELIAVSRVKYDKRRGRLQINPIVEEDHE
jgi:hypothetical protein